MKFGVVIFPGSNCDQDMIYVLRSFGHEVVELWHKDHDLQGVDFIMLPGGLVMEIICVLEPSLVFHPL